MENNITKEMWDFYQKLLGYSNDEMKLFKENPKTEGIVLKGPVLAKMRFIFEIVQSHGCSCNHKKGDKIYFDGIGQLIPELSPPRICAFTIAAASQLIFTAQELVYAGVNPNDMRINKVGCYDVGVHCGGWGNVVLDMTVDNYSD